MPRTTYSNEYMPSRRGAEGAENLEGVLGSCVLLVLSPNLGRIRHKATETLAKHPDLQPNLSDPVAFYKHEGMLA